MLFSIAAVAALPQAVPGTITGSDCTPANGLFKVDSITFDPAVATRGASIAQIVNGTLLADLPEGTTATLVVKLGAIALINQKFNVCDDLRANGKNCPLPAGVQTFNKSSSVPAISPKGTYQGTSQVVTPDGQVVFCVKQTFTLA
ncbi:hypothetical protein EDD86DRAFT_90366 [Gorgonomyces haynaldii]|nr:hypothetical protein EDD86DRAFT_90366 [Gorgonomyces haynaldii]